MHLDPPTVFLVTSVVAAMLGALLIFTWLQSRTTQALLWWGSAFLVNSVGIALVAAGGQIPDFWSLGVGLSLPVAHVGMIWTGARVFDGRAVRPYAMLAGAGLYFGAFQLDAFAASLWARVYLSAFIITTYAWLTAFEVWRSRSEALVSRWPAIVVFSLHGAISLVRVPLALTDPAGFAPGLLASAWQWAPEIERLIYIAAASFILLAMAKERSEQRHRNASLIDPLTELANRRAFMEGATRRMRRAARDGSPVAVLIADLDHFKWVNDRFGHAVGDRVLRLFADTAVACLRPEDLVGRLGGEEFVAILSGAGVDGAAAAAERLRAGFVAVAAEVDGLPISGSVSIGIASVRALDCELDALMARADGALYLAKARGRNRVEIAAGEERTTEVRGKPAAARKAVKAPLPFVETAEAPLSGEATIAPAVIRKPLTH